jgi:hypothetical protein
VAERELSFVGFIQKMESLFPSIENDISLRDALKKIPMLSREPTPQEVEHLLIEFSEIMSRMSTGAMGSQEALLMLVQKIPAQTWKDTGLIESGAHSVTPLKIWHNCYAPKQRKTILNNLFSISNEKKN